MSGPDNTTLLEKLIRDKLSKDELDEFLAGLNNEETSQAYSNLLEAYFQELIHEQEQNGPPESEEKATPDPAKA